MKAPPFAYVRATTLDEVFRLCSEKSIETKLLAGGQSLLATLAYRLSEPERLIDITRLPELKGIIDAPGAVRVGALTTHAELGRSPLIKSHAPMIAEAVPLIGHAAIRNRGTVGGSLANADPAAELPACMVALDAAIVTRSAKGERKIPAGEFFTGLFSTALQDGELITGVELPKPAAGQRATVIEIARRSGDYAMAGIAARLAFANGICSAPRLVFFGVGDRPTRATTAEAALQGAALDGASIARAAEALAADLDPPGDSHGSPEMKRHLARVLLKRALEQLGREPEARAA